MNPRPGPGPLERASARKAFAAAAGTYDAAATLQETVRGQLLQRVEDIGVAPGRILDVGCGTGTGALTLLRRFPGSEVLAADFAESMARTTRQRGLWAMAAEAVNLPLAGESIDLVFSNLVFQWCVSLDRVMDEMERLLRPGGWLLFSTLGPRTLHELRAAWARVDDAPHVHDFMPVAKVESALRTRAFMSTGVATEDIIMNHERVSGLTNHLRGLGAVNADRGRRRALTGKGRWRRLCEAYETCRGENGLLPATFEVFYGLARKRDGSPADPSRDRAAP